MQAVEIGASSIAVDEAYNRRIHHNSTMKKGVEMLWVNPERKANRAVDTALGVIHLRTLAGAPLVSIVNYSAHPTVTMDLNKVVVSADYPGALSRTVSNELGGEVLFLLGAAGDVNPYDSDTKPLKLAVEKSEQLGRKLATTALAAIKSIKSYTRQGGLSYTKENFSNPTAEVSALILAPDIAIAALPGEYFNDFGEQLKAKSPIANTFFAGYANGSIGYVPTEVAAKLGGYGADLTSPDSQVAADTGQRHIDAIIKMLVKQSQTATLKPLGSY
jgi:neutral ceramidase